MSPELLKKYIITLVCSSIQRSLSKLPPEARLAQKLVKKWADYSRLGDLSPHDLRRTAITRALETGLTYRQVHMRYDHGRENMEQSAVNFLGYDEE